ncbi:MAG: hypothetical protein WKF62_09355, partial [Solirubrobacterales bacterium]
AGTPTSYEFDPESKAFELRYSTETPTGKRLRRRTRTEVFMPPIHYRKGYEATATGARITSKPDARVLKLKRKRKTTEVALEVALSKR